MVKQYYNVIENFDVKKDYALPIRPQYKKCLSSLKIGDKVNPYDFTKQHINEFTNQPRSFYTNRLVIYNSFIIGKKIGMLKEAEPQEKGIAMPYEEFCKLDTVQYFTEQLRGSRYKNVALILYGYFAPTKEITKALDENKLSWEDV